MKLLVFVLILFSNFAVAYRPTVDSLFRHARQGEIEATTTVLSYEYKYNDKKYLQTMILSQHLAQRVYLVNKDEKGNVIAKSSQGWQQIKEYSKLSALFYSLLSSLARGEVNWFYDFLKPYSIEIHPQENFINKEKRNLLINYRYFIKKQNENPEIPEEESPLFAKDKDKRQLIDEILKSSYYHGAERAELVKVNDEFFWEVNKKDFITHFELNSRRMTKMVLDFLEPPLSIHFGEYKPYSAGREFPSKIIFFSDNERKVIEITSFSHRDYTPRQLEQYLKGLGEVKEPQKLFEHPFIVNP